MTANPLSSNWRTDKVGRAIYATSTKANDTDPLIGVMDSQELAANVVEAHNLLLVRHDLAETAAELEAKAALFTHVVERLEVADKFVDWILAMDDPLDAAGRTRRQRFNLGWLFEEARVVKATRDDQVILR
jgi:hypothetical protein